jgi:hypothetical protein
VQCNYAVVRRFSQLLYITGVYTYIGPKTIFSPPLFENDIFLPLPARHFLILSGPFCLNSSLFCIYFTRLLPIFSFSFLFLPFSFPLFPCFFYISPFLYLFPKMTSADISTLQGGGEVGSVFFIVWTSDTQNHQS